MNQLVLPDVNEGKQESRHVIDVTLLELAYSYKLKLREYWTGVLSSFNECIADLDIRQVKRIFGEDEVVIEALSVRIDMICHKPEFKTAKRSIKNFLKKHKDRVH